MTPRELGPAIRHAREYHRQHALSATARQTGIQVDRLGLIEEGLVVPTAQELERITAKLEVPIETHDAWFAAISEFPTGLKTLLLNDPEAWSMIRALLAKRARARRGER